METATLTGLNFLIGEAIALMVLIAVCLTAWLINYSREAKRAIKEHAKIRIEEIERQLADLRKNG